MGGILGGKTLSYSRFKKALGKPRAFLCVLGHFFDQLSQKHIYFE